MLLLYSCCCWLLLLNTSHIKIKPKQVSGIMMNEYTGADVTTRLHEEQWLGDLQATSAAHAKAAEKAAGGAEAEGGEEDEAKEAAKPAAGGGGGSG